MLYALLLIYYAVDTSSYQMFVNRQQKDELLKSSTEELVQQRAAMEREMADLKSLLGETMLCSDQLHHLSGADRQHPIHFVTLLRGHQTGLPRGAEQGVRAGEPHPGAEGAAA